MSLGPQGALALPAGVESPALTRLPSPAPGIDVWHCELAFAPESLAVAANLLSASEHARAARFSVEQLRKRYIAGRATLRRILGAQLGLEPAKVEVLRGERGRPYVASAGLDFNVSHTGDHALIGVARTGRIGVDIEHAGRRLNVEGVARKFMTAGEQAALAALSPDARRRALLRLWTCKEAMSKATGDALSAPFGRIEVVLHQGARLVGGPPPYAPQAWTLHAMAAPGDHLATIAHWQSR